jgi:hypothetical protein
MRSVVVVFLYTRVRALRYRAVGRIDEAVRRVFARLVGRRRAETEAMGIVELVSWGEDGKSAVVSLRGREIAGGYDVMGWKCTVELASGRVRVTQAQAAANAAALSKPER